MLSLFLSLLLVFVVSTIATLVFAKLAPKMGLLAEPGEHRLHQNATPMVGGIAIYLALLIGAMIVDDSYIKLMPSLLLLTLVGLADDRYKLPSWSRFIAQGTAAYLMIQMTGVQLNTLGAVFSGTDYALDVWSIPLTVFACIGVINAINMSDGLDGLAGSMVLLVMLGIIFVGNTGTGLALVCCAAVLGYLVWNIRLFRPSAKVFMGDAGSTTLGLLITYLLIKNSQSPNAFPPVTALWLLALPLIDAVAVLIVRPLRGRSPFSADRIHYHHLLLKRNLSVNQVLIAALLIQAMLIGLGVYLLISGVSQHQQFLLFLLGFALYFIRLFWFTRKVHF